MCDDLCVGVSQCLWQHMQQAASTKDASSHTTLLLLLSLPCLKHPTIHPLTHSPPPHTQLLMDMRLVTTARRTFDRALAALPITQHDRVWVLYLVSWLLFVCCWFVAVDAWSSWVCVTRGLQQA